MSYPKQPGQDEQAHRELAQRHLVALQELDHLRADNARLSSLSADARTCAEWVYVTQDEHDQPAFQVALAAARRVLEATKEST